MLGECLRKGCQVISTSNLALVQRSHGGKVLHQARCYKRNFVSLSGARNGTLAMNTYPTAQHQRPPIQLNARHSWLSPRSQPSSGRGPSQRQCVKQHDELAASFVGGQLCSSTCDEGQLFTSATRARKIDSVGFSSAN